MSAVPPPSPQTPGILSPIFSHSSISVSKSPLANVLSIMEEGKGNPPPPPPPPQQQQPPPLPDGTSSPTLSHKIVAEVAGTFILVFAGCGAVIIDQAAQSRLTPLGISIVWGLAAMVAVYTIGHVSGAHINPAVTLAFAASRRFPWQHVPSYAAAQVVGATLATFLLKALHGSKIHAAVTLPSAGTNDLDVIVWEFVLSMILMFVICGVVTDDRATQGLAGVAIGGAIVFNALIAGQITGASMNPARSFGAALAAGKYAGLWMYIVAPPLGTLAGTVFYNFIRLHNKNGMEMTKSV